MKSCSLFGLFWLASFTMVVSFAFTFQGSSTLGHVLLFHSFLLLNDILSYDYTIFCPFIHQLIDIWVISTFWLILILLLWIFVYRFWSRYVFISLAYIPSSGFAGSYGNSLFNHLKKLQTGFFFFFFYCFQTSLMAQASAYNATDPGSIPRLEDLLEKEMETHSSILACKIPWMEEPGSLQSMGLQRVRHDWVTSLTHWGCFAKGLAHFTILIAVCRFQFLSYPGQY